MVLWLQSGVPMLGTVGAVFATTCIPSEIGDYPMPVGSDSWEQIVSTASFAEDECSPLEWFLSENGVSSSGLELLAGDDVDSAMLTLVRKLRDGDLQTETELALGALGYLVSDPDIRALGLETLAAARVLRTEPLIVNIILELLESGPEALRFAAIASAGDLSYSSQLSLAGPIRGLASRDDSNDVRAAAAVFFSYVQRAR